MKLIEWNYLSIFEFNLCTGIIHVLYCYFLISHTFIYDVLLFLATTFAFFLLSSSLHTLQIFTLLNKCTYIYVIFCYFCNITFFPFLILEKFCCFLEEKMHMVSQGFIFNVSKITISTYTNDKKRSCLSITEIDCHIHVHIHHITIRNLNEFINIL